MEKPRHFPVRSDIGNHDRTSWMHPEHFRVFVHAGYSSVLGVCTESPRKIARTCKIDVEGIAAVLHAMDLHGNCRWWPDDEILWNVERADESSVSGKQWYAAQREWRQYPQHVRDAIAERYPVLLTELEGQPLGHLSSGGKGHTDTPPTRGIPKPTVTVTVTDPVTVVTTEARQAQVEAEYAVVRDALCRIKPTGHYPLVVPMKPRDGLRALVEGGAQAEDIIATVKALAERVEAGTEDAAHWRGTYVFSGWYESLREAATSTPKDDYL